MYKFNKVFMVEVLKKSVKTPTIREVAQCAGVSVGTVSRVINGARNVDPEILRRTLEAIKAKKYSPRTVTQILGQNVIKTKEGLRTGNIGALFYDMAAKWRESQIYLEYLGGIETACASRGYHSMVETIPQHFGPELPRCVMEGKVDGLLLRARQYHPEFVEELNRYCPVVLLNNYNPSLPVTQVVSDDRGAAICVVESLIKLGHKRIAFVNMQPDHVSFLARSNGYVEAMKIHGLFDSSLLVEMNLFGPEFNFDVQPMPSVEPIAEAIVKLVPRPTAVIFANDWAASECYKPLKKRGLRIGRDISVVGFDNALPLCELLDPPLASFSVPFRKIAELATSILIEKIEGDSKQDAKMPRIQMLSGELKHRESVCAIT
jgi:LacI family transcriptional regulator